MSRLAGYGKVRVMSVMWYFFFPMTLSQLTRTFLRVPCCLRIQVESVLSVGNLLVLSSLQRPGKPATTFIDIRELKQLQWL